MIIYFFNIFRFIFLMNLTTTNQQQLHDPFKMSAGDPSDVVFVCRGLASGDADIENQSASLCFVASLVNPLFYTHV